MRLPAMIETERLTLRPPRPSDAGPISLYAGDRRVAEMLEHVPHPYPPGAAEAFIAHSLSDRAREHVWVIDAARIDGPEFVGVISVKPTDAAPRLGYWVGPPFWNTGYASEAAAAVVDTLRSAGANLVTARVVAANEASAHVLINAGFVEIGTDQVFSVAANRMAPHRLFSLALTRTPS